MSNSSENKQAAYQKHKVPSLRQMLKDSKFKAGDYMVVFGELFARGYANGIIDEAEKAGLKIIYSTVGRRDANDQLRPLNSEELEKSRKPLINIPLETGFDLEKSSSGISPVDQLQGVKMSEWDQVHLNWSLIEESKELARKSFQDRLQKYMNELDQLIPAQKNILFVHTMAGGVPRAKILMPTMNKVFKGQGERHIPSQKFWESDIGKLSSMNFFEVTADSFEMLIKYSEKIRKKSSHTSYVAYGYHGTEVLIKDEFLWQTYTPYVQGWAKMKLENYAEKAQDQGIAACVYNCPEILTNSSSIFLGVEVSLYPLLGALQKYKTPKAQKVLAQAKTLLKDDVQIQDLLKYCDEYLTSPIIQEHCNFDQWPQHNRQDQMEKMLQASEHLIGLHKNEKELITYLLSEEVFKSTGLMMFRDSFAPQKAVTWLNHDVLAEVIAHSD